MNPVGRLRDAALRPFSALVVLVLYINFDDCSDCFGAAAGRITTAFPPYPVCAPCARW
jgi:hypothetical protein